MAESLTFTAITIVVVVVGAYEQIAGWFFLVPDVQDQVETAITDRFDTFLGLVDQFSFSATIISALIWSLIGAFVFTLLWALINIVADLSNSLKVSATFIHPKSFHQSTFWGAFLFRILFKSSLVIMLVAGGALWVTKFLPEVFTAIQLIVSDTQIGARIIGVLGIAVIIFLSMHMFVIFLRLLMGRERLREAQPR